MAGKLIHQAKSIIAAIGLVSSTFELLNAFNALLEMEFEVDREASKVRKSGFPFGATTANANNSHHELPQHFVAIMLMELDSPVFEFYLPMTIIHKHIYRKVTLRSQFYGFSLA